MNEKFHRLSPPCQWNFSIYNHESISEENIFPRFLIKSFSFWSRFHESKIKSLLKMTQMANVRWTRKKKWMKILKHTYGKKTEKNQKDRLIKKTRKLWKWIVIGGNLHIISKMINWVTSQFLNERILDPCII